MIGGIFLAAVGAAVLWLGIRVRRGGVRGKPWERRYRNRDVLWVGRNAPFGMIPLGIGTLLLGVGVIGIEAGAPPVFAFALAVACFVAMVIGLAVIVIGPSWAKPQWVREEDERYRSRGGARSGAGDDGGGEAT